MKQKQTLHPDFNLPGRSRITGRKSTLTGLFFNSITPLVSPSEQEVDEALEVLGMKRGACVCAYCGGQKSEWDHFRAIVLDRNPTGYITEIANLVPSCGKCNQSKGNKPWREWIRSDAKHSPKRRNVPNLDERIRRLEAYEGWRVPRKLDYSEILGREHWTNHLSNLERVIKTLEEAESHAEACRRLVEKHVFVQCGS